MSVVGSRVAWLMLVLVGAPQSVHCAASLGACACVSNGETFAQAIATFASGEQADAATRVGSYLDVTLRSETDEAAPDSVGIGPRRRCDPNATRPVWRFAVHRAWTVHGPRTRPRSLTLYGQTMRLCPEPGWERGKRYVVFVYPDRDTLRYGRECGRAHSVDSLDTRVGLRVLDSLLRRY